jgi:predicted esterase YcpF (UPF0227 family)
MSTIIYVPGFQAKPKASKKFIQLQKFFPEDKHIQFSWSPLDSSIRQDFNQFLQKTLNGDEDYIFVASSTGCNFVLDVIDYCKEKFLPRPKIVLLNPLFSLDYLVEQLDGFDENLQKQIKSIDIKKLEDNLIIFSKLDTIINHAAISDDDYDYLVNRNKIEWYTDDHSLSNDFDDVLKDIKVYMQSGF